MLKRLKYLSFFLIFIGLIFLGLASWQVQRAQLKYDLQKRFTQSLQQKPVALKNSNAFNEADQYKKVELSGYFDGQHQFLLEHQFYQHQLGYHVITPFVLEAEKQVVLIDRGWIPANSSLRAKRSNPEKITGLVHFPKQNAFILGAVVDPSITWPRKIQKIQYAALQAVLPYEIASFVILLDPNSSYGFIRQWSFNTISYHRHIGYAIQWLIFALIAFGSVIYMQWKKYREKK